MDERGGYIRSKERESEGKEWVARLKINEEEKKQKEKIKRGESRKTGSKRGGKKMSGERREKWK